MRHLLLAAVLASSACASAPPRVRPSNAATGPHALISVAAGRYTGGSGNDIDLTYVADPSSGFCFASLFDFSQGSSGAMPVDCCHLRHVPEVASALPGLATTCPAAPAPALVPPAAAPSAPAP